MTTGLTLDLSKFGIRKVSNFNDGIQFVFSAWKENEIHKKLHLSYAVKQKVALEVMQINNVLQQMVKMEISQKALSSLSLTPKSTNCK